ncbi:MAG: hypothetical protein A3F40_00365 [Chlamydiae bacterium RIFCSPHIGHO2_12_FULL_27_8]|nr:MAG: hypothetical protein A3F40_00365 [Chlamydiae bacterium RIFCSPHIGHO2_12_FULL_27_8]OGN65825.1 MAG: hypothetical protein A2888_02960 [Chlamydiae bacterium RIFCSPLOWO2_01_FULL_28_7]
MENKRKPLEFIKAIISRMASNLFFLRGWIITLIGALLALFSNARYKLHPDEFIELNKTLIEDFIQIMSSRLCLIVE